jgi:hypothetical protein
MMYSLDSRLDYASNTPQTPVSLVCKYEEEYPFSLFPLPYPLLLFLPSLPTHHTPQNHPRHSIYFLSISARLTPPLKAFLARACWSCQRVRAPSTAAPSFVATIVVYVMPNAARVLLAGCSDINVEERLTTYLGRRRRRGGRILLLLASFVGGLGWVVLFCWVYSLVNLGCFMGSKTFDYLYLKCMYCRFDTRCDRSKYSRLSSRSM